MFWFRNRLPYWCEYNFWHWIWMILANKLNQFINSIGSCFQYHQWFVVHFKFIFPSINWCYCRYYIYTGNFVFINQFPVCLINQINVVWEINLSFGKLTLLVLLPFRHSKLSHNRSNIWTIRLTFYDCYSRLLLPNNNGKQQSSKFETMTVIAMITKF